MRRGRGRIRIAALVAVLLIGMAGLAASSARSPASAGASTVLLSAAPDGTASGGPYYASAPSLSRDGAHVAFASAAGNLVTGGTGGTVEVFVRDRGADGTWRTTLVSATAQDRPGNGDSYSPSTSADGSVVAFSSDATDLVVGDLNDLSDVFVWSPDPVTGVASLVRVVTRLLGEPRGSSFQPSLSADGGVVAFASDAPNLVADDGNDTIDVFVHDRAAGTTTLASTGSGGKAADGPSYFPAISGGGDRVAFVSMATDLGPDGGAQPNVYVHDRGTGATTLVSQGASGEPADSSSFAPAISADGRYVAFDSAASNLVGWDSNGGEDVFVRDTASGRTTKLDAGGGGAQGFYPGISPDGSYVAFAVAPPDFATSEYYVCGPLLDDAAPPAAQETTTTSTTSTTEPPPTTTEPTQTTGG